MSNSSPAIKPSVTKMLYPSVRGYPQQSAITDKMAEFLYSNNLMGLLQPFSDAVKLLTKESVNMSPMSVKAYYFSPVAGLVLSLLLWVVYPFNEGGLNLTYGILFFICVSGLGVYPILISGWSSNCKYSMLGSLRAVAQMVSYEVSMAMILLGLVWLSGSFVFFSILESQYWSYNMILVMPLGYLWLVTSLAETNRSPYDFAECESELVSGFNTEYGSSGFTLIFMAEYSSILLMSLLFSMCSWVGYLILLLL